MSDKKLELTLYQLTLYQVTWGHPDERRYPPRTRFIAARNLGTVEQELTVDETQALKSISQIGTVTVCIPEW